MQSAYILQHRLAQLVERLLRSVAATQPARPFEALDCTPIIPHGDAAPVAPCELPTAAGDLDSLDFDIFALRAAEMAEMCVRVLLRRGALVVWGTDEPTLRRWVAAVLANYHDEPSFHNARHAANVLQTAHALLALAAAGEDHADDSAGDAAGDEGALPLPAGIQPFEACALLFAALCHDLQHPGRDNSFLAATGHPLALRYNDRAVLEQHHCAVAFALLESSPAVDVVAALRRGTASAVPDETAAFAAGARFREFRAIVVPLILSTEVASHKQHVEALRAAADAGYDPADAQHRALLLRALMGAADISNESRTHSFSRRWAPLVEAEFFAQGDEERRLGLPHCAMRDRETSVLAREQQGFIKFLVAPLVGQLVRVLPGLALVAANLEENTRAWAEALGQDGGVQ